MIFLWLYIIFSYHVTLQLLGYLLMLLILSVFNKSSRDMMNIQVNWLMINFYIFIVRYSFQDIVVFYFDQCEAK